jgi:hypothetical protein
MQKAIQHSSIGGAGSGFMPPFLIGHGAASVMPQIIGIGMLLTIPEIVKKVKEAIGGTEGMLGELVGAAWGRVGRSSSIAATPVLGAQLGTAGALGGGAAGLISGLAGGQDLKHSWQRAKTWGGKAATAGALSPIAAQQSPRFIGGALKIGAKEVEQMAINELTDDILNKWAMQDNLRGRVAKRELARRAEEFRGRRAGPTESEPKQDTRLGPLGTDAEKPA